MFLHIYAYLTRMAERLDDEKGAGMAEYTLLLVLVALALLTIFGNLATAISGALQRVINALAN